MPATLAFPDDDPHGVTRGYQAEGFDVTAAALELNGPLAPVPYFADPAAPAPRRTVTSADLDLILSDAYLDYLLGARATRPTTPDPHAV